jgi:threonine dehydratase
MRRISRPEAFKIAAPRISYSPFPRRICRGVVVVSSGNHAQAVAIAARSWKSRHAGDADAPALEAGSHARWGAKIVEYDQFRDDRAAIGARIGIETGATLVPPFDHP